MLLPKNYLLLCSGRAAFLNVILIPLIALSNTPFWYFTFLGLSNIFVATFIFIKYKTFTLIMGKNTLTVKSGILLRKALEIKYSSVCALRTFATPLAKHLNLQTPVLYCEGVTFFLPALDSKAICKLQKHLYTEEN